MKSILTMDENLLNSQILSLLQKSIENQCDENELRILLCWLKSPENSKEFDSVSQSVWNEINSRDAYPEEIRLSQLSREVDTLLQQLKSQPITNPKRKISRRNFLYRIASVLLIIIFLGMGYFLINKRDIAEEITYTEIESSRGEIKEYTLTDGTHVILNSGSKLRIPSDYNNENRQITMVGEGFFDVVANTQKPFIIKSGEARVKVLGTSFNVKAYPEDTSIGITVSTGKVLVNIPDIDLQVSVLPMEHLVFDKGTSNLTKVVLAENHYTKWRDGTLFFEKEPLNEVIKAINRKYDRRVILNCNDCNPLISGTHDNKSLKAVIESICFTTGLKSKEENGNIILFQ